MESFSNYSLKQHNTFGVDTNAAKFMVAHTVEDIRTASNIAKSENKRLVVLGGGSNVLFVNAFVDAIVLQIDIRGKTVIAESEKDILMQIGAGENWHDFVTYAVEHEYEGIENMALIPGTVGGAIAGNIAAYGQNISDVLVSVQVVDLQTEEVAEFSKEECELSYRNSIFKREKRYIVLSGSMRLLKDAKNLETNYHERKGRFGSLEEKLVEMATPPYTIKDVYNAVIAIRKNKLPDPDLLGTCGSFFVNPTITKEKYLELTKLVPELQSYPVEDLRYTVKNWESINTGDFLKIPAGRLIDVLGWLGKWEGHVGVFEKHGLCIVTDKKATGEEILAFTNKVKQSVFDAYGIELVSEVEIIR